MGTRVVELIIRGCFWRIGGRGYDTSSNDNTGCEENISTTVNGTDADHRPMVIAKGQDVEGEGLFDLSTWTEDNVVDWDVL